MPYGGTACPMGQGLPTSTSTGVVMLVSFIISLFGKRMGVALMRVLPYLLGILTVVLILWWIYDSGYDNGVADIEFKYQIAIQEERHRQMEANAKALDEARQIQVELERLLDERNTEIENLLVEGSEDPDATRRAIGADSVLRINKIR